MGGVDWFYCVGFLVVGCMVRCLVVFVDDGLGLVICDGEIDKWINRSYRVLYNQFFYVRMYFL